MGINPAEIGSNVVTELKNLTSGEIEIAGKKFPKIAVVGLGIGGVVLFFIIGRKGGGVSASPFRASETGEADAGVPAPIATTDTPVNAGGGVGGDFSNQLSDLESLISANNQTQSDALNSQLGGLQSQIDSLGSGAYPVASTPFDTGYYETPSMGYDMGGGYGGNYGYSETPIPSVKPPRQKSNLNFVDTPLLKPSKIKPEGSKLKSNALLGAKLSKPSGLISKLTGKSPKLSAAANFKPSAVTGFGKTPATKPAVTVSTTKQGKQQITPVKQGKQSGVFGGLALPKPKPKPPAQYGTKPKQSGIAGSGSNAQAKPRPIPAYVPTSFKPLGFSAVPYSYNYRPVSIPYGALAIRKNKKGR